MEPIVAQPTVEVIVPKGAYPGQEVTVRAPGGGALKTVIPEGLQAGDKFLATVPISAQPYVDMEHVVETVRKGGTIPSRMALAYADTIPFSRSNHTGCYVVKCGSSSGIPCACTYNYYCGACLCLPQLVFGIIPWPFICSGEREGNVYVMRGRRFERMGAVMVIDEERGTLANYRTKCCSTELHEKPCCHCVRAC